MIEQVFHLLSGYVRFEVRGESARFFNMAARRGFGFWGYDRREGRASACCKVREYRRLYPLARRCDVCLRCVEKRGAPFRARQLLRRKGMALGVVLGVGFYCYLSTFVWGVTVTGTDALNDRQVLAAAEASGVYPGAGKKNLTPKIAAYHIIEELPALKWASVNTDGCFAEVAVEERVQTPEVTDDDRWSNIVAVREGTVVAIEAERGRPEVALGDTVAAGDLLISGLYQEKPKPYMPLPEDPLQVTGAARGRVIARTYREFTVQASARKKELVPTGERREERWITVFGLRIPLGLHTAREETCRTYTEETTLTALGTALPVSFQRRVVLPLKEQVTLLDDAALDRAALLKLREAQRTALPEGGRVVREELTFCRTDGLCILSAKCRCEEEIGTIRELLCKKPEKIKNF